MRYSYGTSPVPHFIRERGRQKRAKAPRWRPTLHLLPLGLDTNHGFAKVAVENSEVAKRRTRLEQRLARLKQWAQSAGKREARASRRRERLRTTYNARSKELYRELTAYQFTLEEQNLPEYVFRQKLKERKAEIDAELEPLRIKEWQAYDHCNAGSQQSERTVKIRLRFAYFLCNGSAYLNFSREAVPQWEMKKVLTDRNASHPW